MICVNYECDETGQKMEIVIAGVDTDKAEVKINFSPNVSDDTEDPFGIMSRIFKAITPGG